MKGIHSIAHEGFRGWWLPAALALALAGCGGGGGGGDGGGGGGGGGTAAVGSLDTTFGADADGDGMPDGWILHAAPRTNDIFRPADAVRDSAGRIIVTGSMYDAAMGGDRMALWRLNTDGSLDTSFGGDYDGDGTPDGYWLAPATETTVGKAVTLAGTYILVAGNVADSAGVRSARVWRHNALDGSLDTTFGATFTTPVKGYIDLADPDSDGDGNPEGDAEGLDIIVDGSGRIVVAGYGTNASFNRNMAVWRLVNVLGFWGLDSLTFGAGGVFQDPGSAGGDEDARAVAEDASGNLVVAGSKYDAAAPGSMHDMAVWRLQADGSLDTSFGGDYDGDGTPDGWIVHHDAAGGGAGDFANGMTIASDGDILVAGASASSVAASMDAVIWRLTPDGALDSAFNGGFRTLRAPNGVIQSAAAVAEGPGGDILATGLRGFLVAKVVTWRLDAAGVVAGESVFTFGNPTKGMAGQAVLPRAGGQVTVVATSALGPADENGLLVVQYGP